MNESTKQGLDRKMSELLDGYEKEDHFILAR
jgi:hypothetical protein